MLEKIGDLWEHTGTIGVTTNGVVRENNELVMGKGIALQAKQRFPTLPFELGCYVLKYGNRVFYLKQHNLLSFPTKKDWRSISDIKLIVQSAQQAMQVADKFGLSSVGLPPPGCGNGGLTWDFVQPYVADILDDRFVVYFKRVV